MGKIVIALLAAFFLSGCGTIAVRVKNDAPDVKVYPATFLDAIGFYLACCTGFIHMEGKQPLGATIAVRTIVPALMVLDAPISLVTDTILLPYDLYAWSNSPSDTKSPGDATDADKN